MKRKIQSWHQNELSTSGIKWTRDQNIKIIEAHCHSQSDFLSSFSLSFTYISNQNEEEIQPIQAMLRNLVLFFGATIVYLMRTSVSENIRKNKCENSTMWTVKEKRTAHTQQHWEREKKSTHKIGDETSIRMRVTYPCIYATQNQLLSIPCNWRNSIRARQPVE